MHLFIRRLLRFFKTYKVVYEGTGVSANTFYAGGNGKNGWKVRYGTQQKYKKIFGFLIKAARIPKMQSYALVVFYSQKQDADNVVGGTVKLFNDVLKEIAVPDDGYKNCKLVASIYDPTLKPKTTEFIIVKT